MSNALTHCAYLLLAGIAMLCTPNTQPNERNVVEVLGPEPEAGPRTDVVYRIEQEAQLEGMGGAFIHSDFESPTKGTIPYAAYLPPGWTYGDTTQSYPLVMHLYGQGGNEYNFIYSARNAAIINKWIADGDIPPMIIICVKGHPKHRKIQWYTSENETLLTSEAEGELREYAHRTFRTSMSPDSISIQGQSRGATGTLHYGFKFPEKFASAVSCAYVSDYTLSSIKGLAKRNKEKIIGSHIQVKMEIGTSDWFAERYDRSASPVMHAYLQDLGIPHRYDTLSGCTHGYHNIWKHQNANEEFVNGFNHLRYHADAWKRASIIRNAPFLH
jgi:enterochelin esterase-like enzyme